MFIAVYSLDCDKYYIEKTSAPATSFQRHLDGIGGNYTQYYLPKMIIEIMNIKEDNDVNILVEKYKNKYGINNIFINI